MRDMDKLSRRLSRTGKVDPSTGPNAAWIAIAEANRVFGPIGWTRETIEMRNAANREREGQMTSAYVARIRITVLGNEGPIIRESHGCGEGKGRTPFEAHDHGIKAAELDATLRGLATFGNAFGLSRIINANQKSKNQKQEAKPPPSQSKGANSQTSSSYSDGKPEDELSPLPSEQVKTENAKAQETLEKPASAGAMMLPKLKRQRSPAHLAHVRTEPCLVCGRSPVDAHHLRFVQPRAMAKKVSDEFTVPLCRRHHDLLHRDPNELEWWASFGIDPLAAAKDLWTESQRSEGQHRAASS